MSRRCYSLYTESCYFNEKNILHRANVQNNELVLDPTQRLPGFDEPRIAWCRLNRIRTGHGNRGQVLHIWNLAESAVCDRGVANQSMLHIVNDYSLRKFDEQWLELMTASATRSHKVY